MGLWTEYILVQGYISSLQSADTGDKEDESVWKVEAREMFCWDSLGGKMAAGATVLSGKRKDTNETEGRMEAAMREMEGVRRNVSRCGVWLWGVLPDCGSWATAASAVEQKPHEGSVSQHKNKHAGTQP